mmetsp:Transcript_19990/g.46521  ORF Transcript_19990/g.46521 Transcript_19990/m.46521 type:complete len:315 (-) Transcript_19990:60-1004(-)
MTAAADLEAKFAGTPGVSFQDDPQGPSAKAVLQCDEDSAEIYLFGAHIWCWQSGGGERLWQSSLSKNDGSAPMRGGIPIAWPQFADVGSLPLHGFARTQHWSVAEVHPLRNDGSQDKVGITLQLEHSDATQQIWPFAFTLRYQVTLGKGSLAVELEAVNTGAEAFQFTTCLHGYLRVKDSAEVALKSLKGCSYVDKVDGYTTKVEEYDELLLERAAVDSKGFCDRVYKAAPATLVLEDRGLSEALEITQTESYPNTVVFNPWIEGKKGDKGPDYDDDGYKYAICVEPAIAEEAKMLEPGQKWLGAQRMVLKSLR